MDFASFDTRRYPTLGVAEGYGEWARTYEDTVLDLMDLALFERIDDVEWRGVSKAVDLACGTGRIGTWLKTKGVTTVDGVDLTPAMLEKAQGKDVYRKLVAGDVAKTGLDAGAYDLAVMSLADEHLSVLPPMYNEVARLLRPGGAFALVGYHPHFLMMGMPTHFNRDSGEPAAVESHVHLTRDHVAAARSAGFALEEMHEALIDDEWITAKPKWEKFRNHPFSFAFLWKKP